MDSEEYMYTRTSTDVETKHLVRQPTTNLFVCLSVCLKVPKFWFPKSTNFFFLRHPVEI